MAMAIREVGPGADPASANEGRVSRLMTEVRRLWTGVSPQNLEGPSSGQRGWSRGARAAHWWLEKMFWVTFDHFFGNG